MMKKTHRHTLDEKLVNHFRHGHPSNNASNMFRDNTCSSNNICGACLQDQLVQKQVPKVATR